MSTIDIGNPATNVIPAEAKAVFNIRFNDLHSSAALETRSEPYWTTPRVEQNCMT